MTSSHREIKNLLYEQDVASFWVVLHNLAERRLLELQRDKEMFAYCRGPFGLMAQDAAALLRQAGFRAWLLPDGVAE
jgi:rhodanese-related sulfurtransferase